LGLIFGIFQTTEQAKLKSQANILKKNHTL